MKSKMSFWEKLEAYHLKNNMYVIIVLAIITILSLVMYTYPGVMEHTILGNIAIAVFTSLLASIVAISAELYVQFKSSERDLFLEDIHTFGIASLNQNKEETLRELLKVCDKEIWISGYRLIMTEHLKEDIAKAMLENGATVRILACPPWETAYQMIFGKDKVMDNYYKIIYALYIAEQKYKEKHQCEEDFHLMQVRFVSKPIFSDTYRVDQNLVTGPYMHNVDENNQRIEAKNYFSYNVVNKSPLYKDIVDEFELLWEASIKDTGFELELTDFVKVYEEYLTNDYNEEEKMFLMKKLKKDFEPAT